ncbi:hypothetical protein CHUAL_008594 [Chamberlinius hualienensis]
MLNKILVLTAVAVAIHLTLVECEYDKVFGYCKPTPQFEALVKEVEAYAKNLPNDMEISNKILEYTARTLNWTDENGNLSKENILASANLITADDCAADRLKGVFSSCLLPSSCDQSELITEEVLYCCFQTRHSVCYRKIKNLGCQYKTEYLAEVTRFASEIIPYIDSKSNTPEQQVEGLCKAAKKHFTDIGCYKDDGSYDVPELQRHFGTNMNFKTDEIKDQFNTAIENCVENPTENLASRNDADVPTDCLIAYCIINIPNKACHEL